MALNDDLEFEQWKKARGYVNPFDEAPVQPETGLLDRAKDVGISALKGAIGVPEAVVGLADIPTFGLAGKGAEAIGFRPKDAKAMLDEWYSPAQQEANRKVGQAEGFWGKAGAALENPSTIAHTAIESLPAMGVGGVAARGLMATKAIASPLVAGGIGEGVVGAGLAAEQIRQGSDDGYLSPGQVGAAIASGVGTGALGVMGGKLARKMGIEDVDTAITRGTLREAEGKSKRGLATRVGAGMLSEGVLEELPQSMQEQIWQNVATGKSWNEGVAEAGAMGMLTGGVMGGGFNVFTGGNEVKAEAAPEQKKDLLALPYKGIQMPGSMPEIDAMQANSADAVEAVRSNEQLWKERDDYTRSHPGLEGFPRLPGLGQSSYAIPAEATEQQTPLARFDVLQQRSLDTASRELANEQLSDLAQDTRYNMPEFNLNDQTLPMPTDPGSAVAVIQVLSHAQQSGQALVEGSRAHEALVEAQRILKENGLSVLASRAPQVSAKGGRNAPTQVAQAGNQGAGRVGTGSAGNLQDQQRVATGLRASAGTSVGRSGTDQSLGDAGRGNGAGVNPVTQGFGKNQLAVWNDALSKLGENHPALEGINQAISQNKLPVAKKALSEALAPATVQDVKLPKVQQEVFDHIRAAFEDNRADDVVGVDGFKVREIAKVLGKKPGSITAAIAGMRKHLVQFSKPAERTVEASDYDKLGLSPAKQNNQVVNESDLFGNAEAGAEQNMGIINSIGGSQGEVGNDIAPPESSNVQTAEDIERDERVATAARAEAEREAVRLLSHPEATNAAADWDDFKSEKAPSFASLKLMVQADWISEYVEAVDNAEEDPLKAIESAQRDFERQLESTDVRTNETGTPAAIESQSSSDAASREGQLQESVSDRESLPSIGEGESVEQEAAEAQLEEPAESVELTPQSISAAWNDGVAGSPLPTFANLTDDERQWLLGATNEAALQARAQDVVDGRLEGIDETGPAKFSEGTATQGVDAKTLGDTLRKYFFSPEKFNKLVSIYPTAEAIPADVRAAAAADAHMSEKDVPWEHVQGFAMNGKVYLVAGNIKEGNELAVFLHELGVHVGMERLIGTANMKRLSAQIETWAARNDKSQETQFAKDAVRRAADSASEDRQQEAIAYFIEEAVKHGVNPVAIQKTNSPLAQWFRSLWAAAKIALRKIGFGRFDSLTAQNMVDLAYGAARMELTGTWHGTAADFRNFDHSYMGSGEGAQAFGWGTYLAQRVGIAKGYWKDDVRRKERGGVEVLLDGKPFKDGDAASTDAMHVVRSSTYTGVSAAGALDKAVDTLEYSVKYYNDLASEESPMRSKKFKKLAEMSQSSLDWLNKNKSRISLGEEDSPEGSLMRVDTAVHEDEMLDWDKPLSEQPGIVEKLSNMGYEVAPDWAVATGRKYHASSTGSEFYKALESERGSDKAASEYLDSIGIKGIQFLDSQSRNTTVKSKLFIDGKEIVPSMMTPRPEVDGHVRLLRNNGNLEAAIKESNNSGDWAETQYLESLRGKKIAIEAPENQTKNLVIFNDKNIQRVTSQVGASRDRIKFSQTVQGNPEYRNAATLAKHVKEFVFDKSKSAQYATMFGHQLADLAEKVIPGAKAYFNSVAEKQRERVQQEQAIAKIAEAFGDLPKAAQNAANKYIAESTYQSKWGFLPDWYEKDVKTTVDAAMATQFNALPKEAQAIVRDVFKFGSEQQKRFDESVNANLDPKDRVKRNQAYGSPYAPLKRFGDHVVVGKSAEFIKAEDALKQGSITQTQLDDMKSNEKHYYVEFVDGDFEAIQRRDELATDNPNLNWDKKPLQDEHRDLNAMSFTMLERLKNQIANDPDTKAKGVTKAALTSLANQLYIAQLNHLHANKSQAQRLNVKGYDNDMMRAFVSQGRAEAALIASLKTHAATEKSLQAIKQAARQGGNQDTKTRIANEIMRRHVALLNHKETPIQDKLMAVNSAYFLLTSPAYFLTNATQPFVMSLPYMTASHGGKAWGVLAGAYKQAFSLVKFFKNTQLDATHLKGFNEVGQEATALQALLDENLVNIGMEIELGEVADYGGNKATKALKGGMKFLRMIASNVETLNRVSTAVTAYRLAYTEALNGGAAAELAHTKATAYARDVIIKTHGDYAGYNAPSLLMQGAYGTMPVKVLGQFKKFQFIQAGLLIGTAKQALSAADPDERAVARKILAHTLGMQIALAGSLGLPLSGALASALAAMGGDDGEDKEAYLRRLIGNPTLAQFILHGAPAAAGLDVSKRIGMANAFNPLPFADSGTTNKDTAKNLFISAMGPSAALSLRAAQGMDYMGKGQYWKGLENFIPNGLATNLSKVARYESEGVTNSRGDIVMKPEEVGVMTDALQVLGLPTTVLTDRSWKAGVAYDQKQHFQSEAAKIKREYTEAIQNHENPAEARKAWMELQAQRVKQGFKRQQMSELIGAPREQAKRERQVVNGLPYEKTDKQYIERLSTL